jgi:hypothetical protein
MCQPSEAQGRRRYVGGIPEVVRGEPTRNADRNSPVGLPALPAKAQTYLWQPRVLVGPVSTETARQRDDIPAGTED